MRYLSVCSGIEAATCARHVLGWRPFAFSEIENFPSAVLANHYPNVPNLGDMTQFKEWPDATIDLLVGGTPCQSFSIAGLRKGLDDPRGNLMLVYGAIAAKYRPRWLVWENVPGVLSSNGGRDFGTFLGMLGKLGYGFAYRVLDAQFFGVAQRRRRVFVVGYLGDWRRAAAVLFERDSLSGNPAPSRETGQRVANALTDRADRGGTNSEGQRLIPQLARCVTTGEAKRQDYESCTLVTHSLRGEGFDASEDGTGRGTPLVPVAHVGTMPTLRAAASQNGPGHGARSGDSKDEYVVPMAFPARLSGTQCASAQDIAPSMGSTNPTAVAFQTRGSNICVGDISGTIGQNAGSASGCAPMVSIAFQERGRDDGRSLEIGGDVAYSLTAPSGGGRAQERNILDPTMRVRRLTPRECERLQGFHDDYTLITVRGKPAADAPRYKALGNSMAVPCMRWIGERIEMVEALGVEQVAA